MRNKTTVEPIVIEYSRRRPFNVITRETGLDHKGQEQTHICYYDFEYCRRFDHLYHHMSGCGGNGKTYNLSKLIGKGPLREVWVAPSITLTKNIKRKGKWVEITVNDTDLAKLGYRRLKQPRLCKGTWGEKSRNPFEISQEETFVYCPRCNDWLPDEMVTDCGHLEYCEECCEFIDRKSGKAVDTPECVCAHLGKDGDDE